MFKNLFIDIGKYLSIQTLVKVVKWGFVLILGVVLTPVQFGIIGIIKIFEDLLPQILTYGQNQTIQRFFYEKDHSRSSLILSSFIIVTLLNLIFVIIYLFLSIFYDVSILNELSTLDELLLLLTVVLLPNRILLFLVYRMNKDISLFFKTNLIFEIGRIIVFLALIFLIDNTIQAYIISIVLISLTIIPELLKVLNFSDFSFSLIMKYAVHGFPLIFMNLSSIALVYIARIFINSSLGLEYVGYFTFAFTILQFIPFFYRAVNMAFGPLFFESLSISKSNSLNQLKVFTSSNIIFASIIGSFIIYFLPYMAEIFSLLFSVQVYMILPYIFLFVVLMPIRYFQNSLLLAELKQKLNLFSNLIGLIVFIFLCSYFIKYFGFEGVGIILNLSVFSQVLFVYLFNQSGIDFKLIHLLLISTSFLLIYLRTQFEFNYLLFLLSISFAAIIIRKIINTNEQIISKDV